MHCVTELPRNPKAQREETAQLPKYVAKANAGSFRQLFGLRGPCSTWRELAQVLAHVHDVEIEISEGQEAPGGAASKSLRAKTCRGHANSAAVLLAANKKTKNQPNQGFSCPKKRPQRGTLWGRGARCAEGDTGTLV